jgi:hypothetical protein|uniref:Uncharacterized protein n=1 Tax=Fagus sylvatica TaxID=28930 RepID=A0A2N9GIP3_FAGSY
MPMPFTGDLSFIDDILLISYDYTPFPLLALGIHPIWSSVSKQEGEARKGEARRDLQQTPSQLNEGPKRCYGLLAVKADLRCSRRLST